MFRTITFLALSIASVDEALAAASEWVRTDGAAIRLLVENPPPGEMAMRGALEIRLDPGWKTYWRDPGEAGVPPQIDVSRSPNIRSANMQFPAPQRLADDYATFAGYKHPVLLPLTFELGDPAGPLRVDAKVFLGVCESICVPVSAEFILDPARDLASGPEIGLIETAFAMLPVGPSAGFQVSATQVRDGTLVIEAAVPSAGPWQVFVDGQGRASFGVPEPATTDDGKLTVAVPVIRAPKSGAFGAVEIVITDGSSSLAETVTPGTPR